MSADHGEQPNAAARAEARERQPHKEDAGIIVSARDWLAECTHNSLVAWVAPSTCRIISRAASESRLDSCARCCCGACGCVRPRGRKLVTVFMGRRTISRTRLTERHTHDQTYPRWYYGVQVGCALAARLLAAARVCGLCRVERADGAISHTDMKSTQRGHTQNPADP